MLNTTEALQQRAAELWKDNPSLQEKWIGAVCAARSTKRGWLLDVDIKRQPVPEPVLQ